MSGPPGRQDSSVKVAAIVSTAAVFIALLIFAPQWAIAALFLLFFAFA